MDNNNNLTQFYDDLKTRLGQNDTSTTNIIRVGGTPIGGSSQTPGAIAWRTKASKECDHLKDDCCKHILLDIYCKVLPLDNDYIRGHHSQMKSDVDGMLASKGTSATNYLTSCYESTKAPLLEFIIRSTNNIGRQFMEEANETLKDAQENDIVIPEPKADINSKEIEDQLVDVKNDAEYETFIDKLKEKTVNKIVSDVSKVINNKKEEKDMTFDPKPIADIEAENESAISIGIDYIHHKLMAENVDITPEIEEAVIGMAIREATLNQMDVVFRQPEGDFKKFANKIRFGKGGVINESAVTYLSESVKAN